MSRLSILIALAGCSYAPTPASIEPPGDGPGDSQVIPPDTTPDALTCPAGFVTLPGAPSQYRAGSGPLAYMEAVAACASAGANVHLARIDTQAEADALFDHVGGLFRVVGQRHLNNPIDDSDDTWHDLDDVTELTFLPWGNNEPTNLAGELCMGIREEFSGAPPPIVAGADNCTTARAFVCECE